MLCMIRYIALDCSFILSSDSDEAACRLIVDLRRGCERWTLKTQASGHKWRPLSFLIPWTAWSSWLQYWTNSTLMPSTIAVLPSFFRRQTEVNSTLSIPTNLSLRPDTHLILGSWASVSILYDQNHYSEALRDQASPTSQSSLCYVSSHTLRSMSSH